MTYTQCSLRKGNQIDIAWIPNTLAKIGKVLKVKERHKWTDGWVVTKVFATQNDALVLPRENHYRHHRKFTDV